MELRWHTTRTTRWSTEPLYPGRIGSPTHTVKRTTDVTVLQYRTPSKDDISADSLVWKDVPTVVETIDETNGEPYPNPFSNISSDAMRKAAENVVRHLNAQPGTSLLDAMTNKFVEPPVK